MVCLVRLVDERKSTYIVAIVDTLVLIQRFEPMGDLRRQAWVRMNTLRNYRRVCRTFRLGIAHLWEQEN